MPSFSLYTEVSGIACCSACGALSERTFGAGRAEVKRRLRRAGWRFVPAKDAAPGHAHCPDHAKGG
jgi:hypothetical protein